MGLAQDYEHCMRVVRDNSQSFFQAFSGLEKARRDAVFAVYAFCRACDDAVDRDSSAQALLDIGRDLEDSFAGRPPNDPVFRALSDSVKVFSLDIQPFRDMLEGQAQDLDFRQPADLPQLRRYCYLVAGSVGLMILPILATAQRASLGQCARDLGEAMQLTNILRDVGEDLTIGRIYLPADLLDSHALTPLDLLDLRGSLLDGPLKDDALGLFTRFRDAWEVLAHSAESLYESCLDRVCLFDPPARLAVALAAMGYRAILDEVRSQGYDCLSRRAVVRSRAEILDRAVSLVAQMEE